MLITSSFISNKFYQDYRKQLLEDFNIKRILFLPVVPQIYANLYLLQIENNSNYEETEYYNLTSNNIDHIQKIHSKSYDFKLNKNDMKERWDYNFHSKKDDEVYKEYNDKNQTRLSELAEIIPGYNILDKKSVTGDIGIVFPKMISDGKIHVSEIESFVDGSFISANNLKRIIIQENDIVVCTTGRIKFGVNNGNATGLLPSYGVCIVRPRPGSESILKLYFGSKAGEENFNKQANLLQTGSSLPRLTRFDLASFYIPRPEILNRAELIAQAKSFEDKVYTAFVNSGWEVKREYEFSNQHADFVLYDKGKAVGYVEAKTIKDKNTQRVIAQEKKRVEKILQKDSDKIYILFINNNIYEYKNNQFYRIVDIPDPNNYKRSFNDTELKQMQVADNSFDVHALFNKLNVIQQGVETANKKLDKISDQIEELSRKISTYQSIVSKQLEYFDDEQQQDVLLKSLSDAYADDVERHINKDIDLESKDETTEIISDIGKDVWNKLSNETQKYIITAKVTYNKLQELDNLIDYSGVCLLMSKAIELELSKRFCRGYVNFYKEKYDDYDNAPANMLTKNKKYMKEKDFTLGSFKYITANSFIEGLSEEDKEKNIRIFMEFLKEEICLTYYEKYGEDKTKNKIKELVNDVEEIRNRYRNPAAHINSLQKTQAKECLDFVIYVEKILKKMIELFDY